MRETRNLRGEGGRPRRGERAAAGPVYVAGPVTGLPRDNRPAFEAAAGALRDAGYCPVVPHAHIPAGTPWRDAMRRSLGLVMARDGVALIDGWEASRGARLERDVAAALDIPAMPLREWLAGANASTDTRPTPPSKQKQL